MKKLLTSIALALFCSTAQAAVLEITALPSSTVGATGFEHNNLHDASKGDGTDGVKIGWFTLGAAGGTYDNVSGDIALNIDLYLAPNQAMTGTADDTAIGNGNIDPSVWDGLGGSIGYIDWTFSGNGDTVTTYFYDIDYEATSDIGYTPNTQTSNSFTLWGSNGDLNPATGKWDGICATATCVRPTIGVDFAATFSSDPRQTVVPVPAAIWLFGSGLLAIAGISRRQRKHS